MREATPLVLASLDAAVGAAWGGSVDATAAAKPFVVADYGTADGGTSMVLMHELCAALRRPGSAAADAPIQIVYEDQSVNVWHDLFMRLDKIIPGPPSYLRAFDDVYAAAVGRSFYESVVPPGTVHLGISFTAMHWLSAPPAAGLDGAIHHALGSKAGGSAAAEQHGAFAAAAATDWERMLVCRARELAPSGQLVFANFAIDERGQFLGSTAATDGGPRCSMYETKDELWRELGAEGVITAAEVEACTFANYYRSLDEFRAPFDDAGSAVRRAGLKLVSAETRVVRCPYRAAWLRQTGQHDHPAAGELLQSFGGGDGAGAGAVERTAREHAAWFVPTTRTWSNSTYMNALDASRRTDQERKGIVDAFFQRYEERVALAPEDHGMDYVHAYCVMEKE